MDKLWTIGWKDLKVAFRDRAALIMLAGPFVLTLALGFISGAFSGDGNEADRIPIVVVNQDRGELGGVLTAFLKSESMQVLLNVTETSDASQARLDVEGDQFTAAMIIPEGFSDSMVSSGALTDTGGDELVELYSNPGQPIRANIVRSILERFISQVETGVVSSQVAVIGLIEAGVIPPQEAPTVGREIGERLVLREGAAAPIAIQSAALQAEETEINALAILAPSMAMLFLMYTVTSVGGRSILAERDEGTLSRMLATPTGASQVLGGKVLGILLVGTAQVAILIVASSLLFQLEWGDPLGVAVLILAAVAGATGWGILLAAFARTPGQVSNVGTALMLIFGLLGGSFFGGTGFEGGLGLLSKITPNAWAQEGFLSLARGGSLVDILEPVGWLAVMAIVLFTVAVVVFRRRGLARG